VSPWKRRGVPLRGRGDPGLYALLRFVIGLFVVPFYRFRVHGGANVPVDGGVILAVTHKSWGDPILTALAFPRPLRFMAKSELFENRYSRWLVTTLGAFPIKRGSADIEALRATLGIVAAGEMLLMFPEGHRFHDDEIHDFHAGIGMLAVRSGAPILPVALKGTKHLVRDHLPRRPRVEVVIGPPVDLSGLEGPRSLVYETATARVREAVIAAWRSL
jgi:1-acyl-sn-glycerol-3-phosphate acyltransferase